MLTADDKKALRLEFWNRFETFSSKKRLRKRKPAKWIMNDTGIRQLKLKFSFDETSATAGLDVETRNVDKRLEIFGKIERLLSKFEKALGERPVFETDFILPTGKSVSRIYVKTDNVNIYNRDDWDKVMRFFYEKMTAIEDVFIEFRDYLKYD